MPRTITIDNIQVREVRIARDSDGSPHVYAEYQLRSGAESIQSKYEEISARLTGARKAAALAFFDAIAQDLTAELA